jgi:hypothetical protein
MGAYLVEGALADTTGWRVDDALERAVVVTERNQAKISQRVLDLGALEKAHAAVDPMWNSMPSQHFFKHT